uniref:Secreted protein n=1 Tax=Achlya hypogyna TaxID=1202772 RepID=A0A0A7CNY0_ACHHY|nr:secreted protein [Achlya hypogyna]
MIVSAIVFAVLASAAGQSPLKIASSVPYALTIDGSAPVSTVISNTRATSLSVHIASMNLPPGATLTIGTVDGKDKVVYTGAHTNLVSDYFIQNKVVVSYAAASYSNNTTPLVAIDKYFAGTPDAGGLESICSTTGDLSRPAACYATSEPVKYAKARAIARLVIGGSSLCTGWLFGSEGHLLTNNHCINNDRLAASTQVEFGAECASCSDGSNNVQLACKGTIVASNVTLLATSSKLDFALVKINLNAGVDLSKYGYLQARDSAPVLNEPVWLAGHPQGDPLRMAVATSNNAEGAIVSTNVTDSCKDNQVGYLLDTQGGSSGSPVMSTVDNSVVAIHNCGGCDSETPSNGGIPLTKILAYLRANNIALPKNSVSAAPAPTTAKTTTASPATPAPSTSAPATAAPKPPTFTLCSVSNKVISEYYTGLYVAPAGHTANEQFSYSPDTGAIQVQSNGQCLDAYWGGSSFLVHTWPCDRGNNNQKWTVANNQVMHRVHGVCLTSVAGSKSLGVAPCNAADVRQWIYTNCDTANVRNFVQLRTPRGALVSEWYSSVLAKQPQSSWTELWEINGQQMRSFSGSTCLDAYWDNSRFQVHTWQCDPTNGNQQWRVGNSVVAHATHSNLCLDVDPTDPRQAAQVWGCHSATINSNQLFDVVAF